MTLVQAIIDEQVAYRGRRYPLLKLGKFPLHDWLVCPLDFTRCRLMEPGRKIPRVIEIELSETDIRRVEQSLKYFKATACDEPSAGEAPRAANGPSIVPPVEQSSQKSSTQNADPKAPYRTGAPGRPSAIQFVEKEAARRRREDMASTKLTSEAAALHSWCKETHPDIAAPTAKAIENRIRDDHKRWKAKLTTQN